MSGAPEWFGVAVWHLKWEVNVGSLWRSASAFGAAWFATVGERYRPQASDTDRYADRVPLWRFADLGALLDALPASTQLVGVEVAEGSDPLEYFLHPPRACYLLGAEDHGLSPAVLERCHRVVRIPAASLNVACAGSIVMYDRVVFNRRGWATGKRGDE